MLKMPHGLEQSDHQPHTAPPAPVAAAIHKPDKGKAS